MACGEDCPTAPKNQVPPKASWRRRRARRPRSRICLLKGCGRVFRPEQPLTRYCSEACRAEARRWRQWKARRRYRQSPHGKQKRQAQGRRYRERRKKRPAREPAATTARVIPTKFFFVLLRSPRLLRGVRSHPAFAPTAILLACLPPRPGAGSGAGEALAPTASWPAVAGSTEEEGVAPSALKVCRYRPHTLHSLTPLR